MNMPLLIMNVQVYSSDKYIRCLTSQEAILNCNEDMEIKIPFGAAKAANDELIIGERYLVRYVDGMEQSSYPPEFCYVGIADKQLVFSSMCSHVS